ncbi:adenine phosphoribosyltransferase [Psychrobacter sanguinis]|uniref:adenine phosphoribosyltransferase n=1 Tax=Psychrobacter sanguinis TaxID=861445 RepID=UPI00020C976C|nr:adenine phosphoribosyltransferase [Psychrobacter sanguinis]EGK15476.1 adenine phosphoribosyltransferase [Psychrobacter sp. 1501(2011)]MCD9151549.1 adenine phosphoribosyltransferase [Psychrobacter sanguinis]MDY3306211.1 adenine phosphoribosyltransferase [Psychrobacter sanguinis]
MSDTPQSILNQQDATSKPLNNDVLQCRRQHDLWKAIRTVPDFPKPGIDFYDITPLLLDHVDEVIDALLGALPEGLLDEIDCFVAVEARGFVFASLLAGRLGKGMILLRKPGKLPPPVANKSYALEYGSDTLEIQGGLTPKKVLLVDDILATGGTLNTAYNLCKESGHDVTGVLVLLDLVDLHPAFPVPVYTVLEG